MDQKPVFGKAIRGVEIRGERWLWGDIWERDEWGRVRWRKLEDLRGGEWDEAIRVYWRCCKDRFERERLGFVSGEIAKGPAGEKGEWDFGKGKGKGKEKL